MAEHSMDFFVSRDDMLRIFGKTHMEEFMSLMSPFMLGGFIYNPREKRLFFTDGMKQILGQSVSEGVVPDAFLQYVVDEDRPYVKSQLDIALKDLINGAVSNAQIDFTLRFGAYDTEKVTMVMRLCNNEGNKYPVGLLIDKPASKMERCARQLFSGTLNEYFFMMDFAENVLYVNDKFVNDFALPSWKMENCTERIAEFLPPEDYDKLKGIFEKFMHEHTLPEESVLTVLSPARGKIYLKCNGLSDSDTGLAPEDRQGRENDTHDKRFLSGSFTEVTEFIRKEQMRRNIIEGTEAITFQYDIKRKVLKFSENIRELFEEAKLEYTDDCVEPIASKVIPDDQSRFVAVINQVFDGNLDRYAFEVRIRNQNGKVMWIACRGKTYIDEGTHDQICVGTLFDMTSMNETRENVEKTDSLNELTGLPMRNRLLIDAKEMIRNKNLLSAAIVMCDVNGFHSFNDRYGRSAGNEILIGLANILSANLPEGAKLYHSGVDIFVIMWPHATRRTVSDYMDMLTDMTTEPIDTGFGSFFVSLGLSASIYPYSGSTIDELLVNAEIALHKVKKDKNAKYAIYSPTDKRELKERLDFELQILQSIRNNMESFQLHYQPLIDAKTGKLDGAEALLRWVSDSGDIVNPERVVGALESTDQMEIVGTWILEQAISQCATWINNGAPKSFYVHINVTADDLVKRDFADKVLAMLKKYDLPAANILVEITETSLMKNLAMSKRNLIKLRTENVRVALDDFGTGYSSFNYLKELPVDEIKIDKTFVDDVETDKFNQSFISSITTLVHSMNKKVVVEGVENENQVNMIREYGADIFQGYFFSRPLTVFNFENKYFKKEKA
ncbi:diguanylate cyclase (GGDEF) domain-containing protein [Ruminococcaceae bacterium YRB3002]|nr:diguanylate cyclase (GGDEF) domain-containing protein [Ruminococcaceae bacterium YRB3002]